MSLEDFVLPGPPKLFGGEMSVPPYYQCGHPYTKWMLNMLRGGASFRISTMIKERPELFQQIYQIPDWPDLVRHQTDDNICMFNRHTILYLNPLCLAIYMKKDKSVELILRSGLNCCAQKCWATEVFSRSQTGGGDLLEIQPICIAIRREYFEVIPILVQCSPRALDLGTDFQRLGICDRLDLRYESREIRKCFRYRDSLQYAMDTLKKRGNLPVARLLELFILDCGGTFSAARSQLEQPDKSIVSLFHRIIRTAFYEDPDCRIAMQLIQCLEVLLRHRFVPWTDCQLLGSTVMRDYNSCLTLLLALYNKIQLRIKNGPLDNLGYLLIKTLNHVQWQDRFFQLTEEQIQQRFGKLDDDSAAILVPLEAIVIIKRHLRAIIDLEKEREFKSPASSKARGISVCASAGNNHHRRSYSLKLKSKCPLVPQNLLQSRQSNHIHHLPDANSSHIRTTKLQELYWDQARPDDLAPLFSYQTGQQQHHHSAQVDYAPLDSKSKSDQQCKALPKEDSNNGVHNYEFSECSEDNSTLNCAPILSTKPQAFVSCFNNDKVRSNGDIPAVSSSVTQSCDNPSSILKQFPNEIQQHHEQRGKHQILSDDYNVSEDIELTEDYNNQQESEDDSVRLTDDEELIEFEDEILNELYMEYSNRKRNKSSKNKSKPLGEIPLICKRSSNFVNNISSKYIFSRM